jgi:hypothetical protein
MAKKQDVQKKKSRITKKSVILVVVSALILLSCLYATQILKCKRPCKHPSVVTNITTIVTNNVTTIVTNVVTEPTPMPKFEDITGVDMTQNFVQKTNVVASYKTSWDNKHLCTPLTTEIKKTEIKTIQVSQLNLVWLGKKHTLTEEKLVNTSCKVVEKCVDRIPW